MKVPQSYTGRTKPSSQGLSGIQIASPSGGDIGASVARLGAALSTHAEKVQAQEKFGALRQMSDWEAGLAAQLENERRASPMDDANYYDRASGIVQSSEATFLNQLPPHLQAEFSARSRDTVNRMLLSELEFDNKKKDTYFETGLTASREQRKLLVSRDVSRIAEIKAQDREAIEASGLSEAAKAAQLERSNKELSAVGYRQRYREEAGRQTLTADVAANLADKIIGVESSNRPDARPIDPTTGKARSSAAGYAQVIDSTWRSFILARHPDKMSEDYLKYRSDYQMSREFVEWYAEQNTPVLAGAGVPINEGTLYLAHFLGPQMAAKVYNSAPGTPVEEVLSAGAITANPEVLRGKSTAAVVDWAYQKMGRAPGYAMVDDDPEYAALALEDRLAIRDDVDRELAAQRKAAAKAEDDRIKALENEFLVGAEDGRYGRGNLDMVRQQGLFKDHGDLRTALSIFERREKEGEDLRNAQAKFNDGMAIWSPDNADDKKSANLLWKDAGGEKALAAGEPAAIVALNNFGRKTQMYPPDALNQLNALTQSRNWQQAQYAYDILAQLRKTAPAAFDKGVSDDEMEAVLTYEQLRGSFSAEEMQRILQPPQDAQEFSRRKALREQATDLLAEKDYTPDRIFEEFQSWMPTLLTGEEPSIEPGSLSVLTGEFTTLFKQNFSRIGDEEKAKAVTLQMMQRSWGFSSHGGGNRLMKYAPEKFYAPFAGDHSYIDEQVRELYGLEDDARFQLFADAQTETEVLQMRGGGDVKPSYKVAQMDDQGVLRVLDRRVNFEVTPAMMERELLTREATQLRTDLRYAERELESAQKLAYDSLGQNVEIDPELSARVERLREAVRQADNRVRASRVKRGRITVLNPDGTETEIQRGALR